MTDLVEPALSRVKGEDESARSRSPKRGTEWISRVVAGFGRYPERRPPGLRVDVNGGMRLDSLVSVWGREHGLTEKKLLDAIKTHLFHEPDEKASKGLLRFVIDTDAEGFLVVRTRPKRAEVLAQPVLAPECATPLRVQRRAPTLRGSVLRQVRSHPTTALPTNPAIQNTASSLKEPAQGVSPSTGSSVRQRSSSQSICGPEDDKLAKMLEKTLNVASEVVMVDVVEGEKEDLAKERVVAGMPPAPLPPPGEFWTKYVDDDAIWWHYEGPLGQWWFSAENGNRPMPYGED
jgi:hypothetical protein